MIPDEDAEKPAGWLDDEPADMPDPGRIPCGCAVWSKFLLVAGFSTGWPVPQCDRRTRLVCTRAWQPVGPWTGGWRTQPAQY